MERRPIIIVKCFAQNKHLTGGERFACWQKVSARRYTASEGIQHRPFQASFRDISKEKAQEMIEALGLVETITNEYGTIYDTPDKAFLKCYEGKIYYGA